MKRNPFDEVCACEYETETHYCLCTRKKGQAKATCQKCLEGKHKLFPKIELYAPKKESAKIGVTEGL